jgi:hypothetical protein
MGCVVDGSGPHVGQCRRDFIWEFFCAKPEQHQRDLDVLGGWASSTPCGSRSGNVRHDLFEHGRTVTTIEAGGCHQLERPAGVRSGPTEGASPLGLIGSRDLPRAILQPGSRMWTEFETGQIVAREFDVGLLSHRFASYTKSSQ